MHYFWVFGYIFLGFWNDAIVWVFPLISHTCDVVCGTGDRKTGSLGFKLGRICGLRKSLFGGRGGDWWRGGFRVWCGWWG